MSEQCPNCLSIRIGKNNYGKKAAGVIGWTLLGLEPALPLRTGRSNRPCPSLLSTSY